LPEWLIERGIGETRAALVDRGGIVEARIELEGAVRAGSVVRAQLISAGVSGRNAVALATEGGEYLLPRGAPGVTQGSALALEVTREAIPGTEPWKRPLARVTDDEPRPAPPLRGREVAFPSPRDELAEAGWNDLLEEARSQIVRFPGGELRISPTPAMTLIDVDGQGPPEELGIAGARAAASAIRRFAIGGSIGIDLPTVGSRSGRQAAAAAIDATLPQPFERTAVNGFGFVQVVRPRLWPSLVELAHDRAAFEARALLRRAALERAGPKCLVAHPAVVDVLVRKPEWLDRLARQVGGAIELRADPGVPMSGGYAQGH
jgi:hypothetical protein